VDTLAECYIPTRETMDLRELVRHRAALVRMRTKLKNKIHSIMLMNGTSVSNVVAGLFNQNMSSPPTGKVNGLLVKGGIKSADLHLTDLVHLINGHVAYVNVHTQHQNGEIREQIRNG
jgi:hypothetical protein